MRLCRGSLTPGQAITIRQLLNPEEGKLVFYDDCQQKTGMMVEAKGPGYAGILSFQQGK